MKKLDRNDPHTRRILTAGAFFLILVIGMIYSSHRGEESDATYLSFWSSGCFTVADQNQKREKVAYDEIREIALESSQITGSLWRGRPRMVCVWAYGKVQHSVRIGIARTQR